jgi:hypothetical protein
MLIAAEPCWQNAVSDPAVACSAAATLSTNQLQKPQGNSRHIAVLISRRR